MKFKTLISNTALALLLTGIFVGCEKNASNEQDPLVISQEDKQLVAAEKFNSNWFENTTDGNYIIEGDILLTPAQLRTIANTSLSHNFIVANEEHYRTFELVNTFGGVRTITVS